MKEILVGSTGFVGSNLSMQHTFEEYYHSVNVEEAFESHPDILVYAGVPSEMFTANENPLKDLGRIKQAKQNIEKIAPRVIILISTIAVYPDTKSVDEYSAMDAHRMTVYGGNRYNLECWVEENWEQHIIVRLPAIFGPNLKKNFIYDYIHRIPSLLRYEKFNELSSKAVLLKEYYMDRGDGFYQCRKLSSEETDFLKHAFNNLGFNALNFTDSRSVYQFYPLKRLWDDICHAYASGIRKINLVTPPVSVAEVYEMLEGRAFINELAKDPFNYDVRTSFCSEFGRDDGYIMSREEELCEIKDFVTKYPKGEIE